MIPSRTPQIASATAPYRRAGRLLSVDLTRAGALLALLLTSAGYLHGMSGAFHASALAVLAVVAGMSLTLATEFLHRTRGWRGVIVWALTRGALLAGIGGTLCTFAPAAGTVLMGFGVAIAVVGVLLVLPTWVAAVGALLAVGVLTAPLANLGIVATVLLLIAPMIVGILLTRAGQKAVANETVLVTGAQLVGVAAAAVVAVVVFGGRVETELLSWPVIGGVAVGVLVISLFSTFTSRLGGRAPVALQFLAALGATPLTLGVLSVVLLATPLPPLASVIIVIAAAILLAAVNIRSGWRGPLEALLNWMTRCVVRHAVAFNFAVAYPVPVKHRIVV